jgi:hypothetical protein
VKSEEIVLCAHCKKVKVYRNGFQLRHRENVYCSRRCRDEAAQRRITIQCALCGRKRQRTPNRVTKTSVHYCDRDCADTAAGQQLRMKRLLWTPTLLQALRSLHKDEPGSCGFPGCGGQKKWLDCNNPLGLCAVHLRRARNALNTQRRTRVKLLAQVAN